MSLLFVNALADPARQHFLTHCLPTMPFDQTVTIMWHHYNSDTWKLKLQSEVDSLELLSFLRKHHIADVSEGLTKLADHITALASQLSAGFGDDTHKIRHLRRAVMRQGWA